MAHTNEKMVKLIQHDPIVIIMSRIWGSSNSSEHTLSGRIGKVVASHAAVARSIPA